MSETVRQFETETRSHPPISIRELFQGSAPSRDTDFYNGALTGRDETIRYYEALAEEELRIFSRSNADDSTDYFVMCPRVNGNALNKQMYIASPNKVFGWDTEDIMEDWVHLFNGSEESKRRLERHRSLKGWHVFEEKRQALLDSISTSHEHRRKSFKPDDPSTVFMPILHWNVNNEGKRTLSVDGVLPDEIMEECRLAGYGEEQVLSLLGPLFVATFSPDSTTQWPRYRGYSDNPNPHKSNAMGPTQIIPLTLMFANQADTKRRPLNESDVLKRLEMWVTEGRTTPFEEEAAEAAYLAEQSGYLPPGTGFLPNIYNIPVGYDADGFSEYVKGIGGILNLAPYGGTIQPTNQEVNPLHPDSENWNGPNQSFGQLVLSFMKSLLEKNK